MTTATVYCTVSAENSCDVCSVQNAAARFITGTRKYDHITPVLRNHHWLSVRQRIIFKIATLMYRCLNGLAPSYLAADCIVVSAIPGRRQLRSACHLRAAVHSKNQNSDIWTEVIQDLYVVRQSGMNFPLG